jgi:predicted alpha/beta-fold hydrolase
MGIKKILTRGAFLFTAGAGLTAGFTYGWTFALHRRFREHLEKGPSEEAVALPKGEKSMGKIGTSLRQVPFSPKGPYFLRLANAFGPDLLPMYLDIRRSTAGYVYSYPTQFEKVEFESIDGTPLVGVMGLHRDGVKRPGAVFCHGLFGSKNMNYVMNPALEAFSGWDYNVLVLDLRNFGESQRLSHSPTTGGWKEGQDVLGACRFLGEREEVTSVAAVGYSLGSLSVMNAAYRCKDHPFLSGGAIAWNGAASMERMVSYISTRPPVIDMFFPVYLAFKFLHEMRRQDMLQYVRDEDARPYLESRPFTGDFKRYMEEVVAPHYERSPEEIYKMSSPSQFISEVDVPLLVIHAEDDPICPVAEMDDLGRAAEGNPNVDIWVLPTGNHCAFDAFDRRWYWSVMRGFLDYWADRPDGGASDRNAQQSTGVEG